MTTWNSLLSNPDKVLKDLETKDVRLTYGRGKSGVVLTTAALYDARGAAMKTLGTFLSAALVADKKLARKVLKKTLPWFKDLPGAERRNIVSELGVATTTGTLSGDWAAFAAVLSEGEATAAELRLMAEVGD